jgi:uncharacterized protein involved in exopolysaccharide biosynthesis
MNKLDGKRHSLNDLVALIFRHKKKVVLVPLASFLLGFMLILFLPRAYQSEAKLFLQVGRGTVGMDPTATIGKTISLQRNGRNEEVKSAREVLLSRGIISKVVDQLGVDMVLGRIETEGEEKGNILTRSLSGTLGTAVGFIKSMDPISDREKAIIRIERSLHVEAQRDSTVIVVTYMEKSPQLAQTICEAVVEVFQQEYLRIHSNQRSQPFFENQRNTLRGQLDGSLAKLRDVKDGLGLSNIIERRTTLEYHFKEVELAKFITQQAYSTSKALVVDLEKKIKTLPARLTTEKISVPNDGADLLREELYALQVKSMALKARYTDSHPLAQAAAEQVREAEKVVANQSAQRFETTDNLNPVYQQLDSELKRQQNMLAGQNAKLVQLKEQKQEILADLRSVNGHEIEIDQLEREVQIARSSFIRYSDNLEQARAAKELENANVSNVSLVQDATLQEKPATPSKLLILLSSLMLATGGTVGLVLISEMMSNNLRTEEDIENTLGLPVLASIPDQQNHDSVLASQTNGRTRSAVAEHSDFVKR